MRSSFDIPARAGREAGLGRAAGGLPEGFPESLFLVGLCVKGLQAVAYGVEGLAQGVFRDVCIGHNDGLCLGVGGGDLFHGEGPANDVVDVAFAHAAHHSVDF